MPTFQIPFTTKANYTLSDANKIDVANGNAENLEDKSNVYARWHLNESSGVNAPDDSGNGRDGTLINGPTWGSGKINNALTFVSASSQYINVGNIANFERTQAFSLEFWAKTVQGVGQMNPISRWDSGTGWITFFFSGKVKFAMRSTGGGAIDVENAFNYSDNAWHHYVWTYDGSSTADGFKLYIDNVLKSLTTTSDNITGSILSGVNTIISGLTAASAWWDGQLDELVIYDRVLTASEVAYRYNSNVGRENFIYYSDDPNLYKTAGDSGIIQAWTNFVETMGGGNQGSAAYQLSEDGVNWKYWNGSAWVAATTEYNTEATINTNIPTFPISAQKIYVKSFLISDGTQKVEIDLIQIGYTDNQLPLINAGTNKTCFDNQTISPFSDCSFSDPEGTVDVARYKIDGEVDIWTEIPIGGYGSLVEAVQAFQYQFNNIGVITARLQVEDNQGGLSEDSLTVTVSKYTTNWIVKDPDGNHLKHINFDAGDGAGVQLFDSPFVYDFESGESHVEISKPGWIKIEVDINITEPNQSFLVVLDEFLLKSDIKKLASTISEKINRPTDVILEIEDDSIEIIVEDDETIIMEIE